MIEQSIATVAQRFGTLCKTGRIPHHIDIRAPTNEAVTTPIPISLPIPKEITSSLVASGCPLEAARLLSDAYIKSVRQIRETYISAHSQAWQKISQRLHQDTGCLPSFQRLMRVPERQYMDQIKTVEQLVRSRALELQKQPCKQQTKPAFNQEFIPFLEKYFEHNAYPSVPDRIAMARKSLMTPRQIEVWFQNHRNRAKKEGKVMRRPTPNRSALKLMLEETTSPCSIPTKEQTDTLISGNSAHSFDKDSGEDVASLSHLEMTAFTNTAPPHAFPTPYSPASQYKPKKFTFADPVWMRNKATTRLPTNSSINIDELIMDFTSKLTIRDSSKRQWLASSPSNAPEKRPWFAATHTIPLPAPHPAFIPSTSSPVSTILTPTSMSYTASNIDALPPNFPITQRKIIRLPKRTPKHSSVMPCGENPEVSPSSRSFTPRSRFSSFSSDDSSFYRASSPSTNSSTTSSTLTTPVFSPTSLPENAPSPISIFDSDLSNMDDLFGDYPSITSPPDEDFLSHECSNVPIISTQDIFNPDSASAIA